MVVTTSLTPELICDLLVPEDVAIARDGHRVAWRAAPNGVDDPNPRGGIWTCETGSGRAERWTHGPDDCCPRWSPDGRTLALLSDRADRGVRSVYLLEPGRGEARALYAPGTSVVGVAWSPLGDRLAALVPTPVPFAGGATGDEQVFGEDWRPCVVHVVDLATGTGRAVTDVGRHVTDLTWSPDGARIAVVSQPDVEPESGLLAEVEVVDVATGARSVVCSAPWADQLSWLERDDTLVFKAPLDPQPLSAATFWTVPATEDAKPVAAGPGPDDTICVIAVRAAQPDTVVVAIADDLETIVRAYPVGGESHDLARLNGDIKAFDIADTHQLGAAMQAPGGLIELWSGRPRELVRCTSYGEALAGVELAEVGSFVARSSDGLEIDVISIAPPARFGPGPHPTVVLPHGGPYGRSNLGLHCAPLDWGQLMATAGIHVLMPNYRGGNGKGYRFAVAARADMGGAEWKDVEAAVDRAIELGLADPDRLGIGGWSQGGFLAAWAVTQTDRYRASIVGAGVTDWRSLVLTTDKPLFEGTLAGSIPWEPATGDGAVDRSPVTFAGRVSTPVLILQGERDVRIPVSQATGYNRALRAAGADVALVVYPREPHVIRERTHQIDVMRRALSFFRSHLVD